MTGAGEAGAAGAPRETAPRPARLPRSPQAELQLRVQEPEQGPPRDDLRVAVVQRQPPVAHVLAVDAFGSRGNTYHLGVFDICA